MSQLESTKPQGFAPIRLTESEIAAVFNKIKHRKVARSIGSNSIRISSEPLKERSVPAVAVGSKSGGASGGGKKSGGQKKTDSTEKVSTSPKKKKKSENTGVDKRVASASL